MLRILCLLLLLMVPPGAAWARWFDFELVIFAHEPVAGDSEAWPADTGMPNLFTAQPLLPTASDIPGMRRLGPGTLRLREVADRLRRAPGYRLLEHVAWRQDVRGSGNLPWVRIGVLDNAAAQMPLAAAGHVPPPLAGIVRFTLRRYLHLEVDLVHQRLLPVPVRFEPSSEPLAVPLGAPPVAAATTYWQPFRMRQSRRMRSGELHHVDHPAFGILALATPWTPPGEKESEPEPEPAAGEAAPADATDGTQR